MFSLWGTATASTVVAQEPQDLTRPTEPSARESSPTRERERDPRELGEHRFIPLQVVSWPLVTTRVTSVTGLGSFYASISNDDRRLIKLLEGFVFDWAVLRWLSISGQVIGAAAQGVELEGVYRAGQSYAYGSSFGAIARIVQSRRVYLSARLLGGAFRFQSVVPQRLLDNIDESVDVDVDVGLDGVDVDVDLNPPDIDEGGKLYRVKPVLATAISVRHWLGLQASGGVDVDTINLDDAGTDVNTTLDLGGGASFALNRTGVPLTILLGARLLHDFQEEEPFNPAIQTRGTTRGEFELGLYYSGRHDLDLGLTFTSAVGDGDYSILGNGVITYYW